MGHFLSRRKGIAPVGAGEQRHRVQRLRAGVLFDLDRGQRAVRHPGGGLGGTHAVEGLAPDPAGRLEALDLHRVAAVVAAAFADGDDARDARAPQEVAGREADRLRALVAGQVIGDAFGPRRRARGPAATAGRATPAARTDRVRPRPACARVRGRRGRPASGTRAAASCAQVGPSTTTVLPASTCGTEERRRFRRARRRSSARSPHSQAGMPQQPRPRTQRTSTPFARRTSTVSRPISGSLLST